MRPNAAPRLGLLINPIAGMGGPVGLKGTDGRSALQEARRRGAQPQAAQRARRAMEELIISSTAQVLAAPGPMGEQVTRQMGLSAETTGPSPDGETGPADTDSAVREMLRRGVDLLMFAGGDGTARDIYGAIGDGIPLVGVPTGVKMHSGVFASSPPAAGAVAAAYLRAPERSKLRPAEIADVEESAARAGRVATRLHGSALIPAQPKLMMAAKASSSPEDHYALKALCAELAANMEAGRLYLIGPGTSTAMVLAQLGLRGTLLGVDAVRDGALVGADLDEAAILRLVGESSATSLICGVVGGQGSLFGRGNQQLSAKVLRAIGRDALIVLSGERKLHGLDPPALRIDTGEEELDDELCGYLRVHIAPNRTMMMRVSR